MLLEDKSSAFKTSLCCEWVFIHQQTRKSLRGFYYNNKKKMKKEKGDDSLKRQTFLSKKPLDIKKEEINLSLFPLLMNDRRTLLFVFCYFFFSEIENVFLISLHSIVHFFRTNDDLIPLAKTCTCRY